MTSMLLHRPRNVVAVQLLSSVLLSVTINSLAAELAPNKRHEGPWGEMTGGLQSRVIFTKSAFKQGEPIVAWVEVRNVSDKAVHYDGSDVAGCNSVNHTLFKVSRMNGEAVPDITASVQINVLHFGTESADIRYPSLPPGGVKVFGGDRLDAYYYLRRPGRYKLYCPRTSVGVGLGNFDSVGIGLVELSGKKQLGGKDTSISGTLEEAKKKPEGKEPIRPRKGPSVVGLPRTGVAEIEVLPVVWERGGPDRIGPIINVMPRGWKVEGTPLLNGLGGIGGGDNEPGFRFGLIHRPHPNSNVSNAFLSVRLMEEKIPKEELGESADYLGKGKFGHVYLYRRWGESHGRWSRAAYDIAFALGVTEPVPEKPEGPDWGRMVSRILARAYSQSITDESLRLFCDSKFDLKLRKGEFARLTCGWEEKTDVLVVSRLAPQPPDDAAAVAKEIKWDGRTAKRVYSVKKLGAVIRITVESEDASFRKAMNAILDSEVSRVLSEH